MESFSYIDVIDLLIGIELLFANGRREAPCFQRD
jgi:hypothetical protein